MAPLGKEAMTHGITGIDMVSFRIGAPQCCFGSRPSSATRTCAVERPFPLRRGGDIWSYLSNQCCFTIGLSLTSPVNYEHRDHIHADILYDISGTDIEEPITGKKALGVFIGCCGSCDSDIDQCRSSEFQVGDIRGDLLCLGAQVSLPYICHCSISSSGYNPFTVNKWMFMWACIFHSAVFLSVMSCR